MLRGRCLLLPRVALSVIATLVVFIVFWALAPATAAAEAADFEPQVRIMPNSIQRRERPMGIELWGPRGRTVHLFVLQSCARTPLEPALQDHEGCQSPLRQWSVKLEGKNPDRLALPFDGAAAPGAKRWEALPSNTHLWLRASSAPAGDRSFSQAYFGVFDDPCGLWQTVIGLFRGGRCELGVRRAFSAVRSPEDTERPVVPLEVARIRPMGEATPRPLAGTLGASGVSWESPARLLVSIGRVAAPPGTAVPAEVAAPGLYRLTFDASGEPAGRERLVAANEQHTLVAPLALGDGRIAFVRERVERGEDGIAATLVVWRDGKVLAEHLLRFTVHQLLAVDAARRQLFGYSRWKGKPTLFLVELGSGAVTNLGFEPALTVAAWRSPAAAETVVAYPDASGQRGWELALADSRGKLLRPLVIGAGEVLMPSWRPDGGEVAFLAEVRTGGGR